MTHSAQNNVLAEQGLHKCSIAPDGSAIRKSKPPETTDRPPDGSMSSKQCLFQHIPLNVGNTCFFNSVLQVVASLQSFVLAIENTPHNQDHADSSYCLAFLKLFMDYYRKMHNRLPNYCLIDTKSCLIAIWLKSRGPMRESEICVASDRSRIANIPRSF